MMSSMIFGSILGLDAHHQRFGRDGQRGRSQQIVAELCDLSEAGLLADKENFAKVLEQRLGDFKRRARPLNAIDPAILNAISFESTS